MIVNLLVDRLILTGNSYVTLINYAYMNYPTPPSYFLIVIALEII